MEMKNESLPGVIIGTTENERVVSCDIQGMADIENRRPMTLDTVVWMASCGKTVTSVAMMMLVEAGSVSLDDPAFIYLPHFKRLYKDVDGKISLVETTVTVRHLLSHTSGLQWLPGFFQDKELSYINLETQSHVYAASPLKFEPGTSYSYSNAGINCIGRIIEVVTGKSYESFVSERIFEPLGMADTGYFLTPEQESRRAVGYSYDKEGGQWVAHRTVGQMSMLPYDGEHRHAECGGGLFSTTRDMLTFVMMLANKGVHGGRRYISEASLKEMCRKQTPEGFEYGLGSTVGKVGHGGAWATVIAANPDTGKGEVIIRQRIGEWPSWYTFGVRVAGM